MSDHTNLDEVRQYIRQSIFGVLSYVREDLAPIARSIGSFAIDGDDLFFSTAKNAAKVREIALHPRVSFHFEHEGQSLENWKNVLLVGDAELTSPGSAEHELAVGLLSAKSPRFRDRVERGEVGAIAIFRVRVHEFQYLDVTKGYVPARIDLA
jgi:nitroimidazol reductase NimA-like FMN-containing flavoprotein (pyridoxamine 5'-phosphate oxidase superfamily)